MNAFRHQGSQSAVDGFIHAQHHAVAQHVAENLNHGFGGEGLIVAQHRLNVFVAVDDEDGFALLTGHRRHVDPLDRSVVTLLCQLRVGVANIAQHDVVECREVFEFVE